MANNDLIENLNADLKPESIKINRIENHKDYLLIVLENDQKFLTNGKEIYDVSDYDNFVNIFVMGDKLCAVLIKNHTQCLVNLKTMEVLFKDSNAYCISKQDDKTLHVIMEINSGNTTVYDIETKKYLPVPENYEFEEALGDGLYVFREKGELKKDFHKLKRYIINSNGGTVLTDIEGYVNYNGNHLIISKKDELVIIETSEDNINHIKTIKKNETIIAKPQYYKGNIIIVEKNAVKIYNTSLELLKSIEIIGLNEVIDLEWVGDVLKLLISNENNEEKINKHVFVNLESGTVISHVRIEGYPYWTPTTFIGHDCTDRDFLNNDESSKPIDFHFYNSDLKLVATAQANSYHSVNSDKECMFFLITKTNVETKKQLINTENGSIKEVDYDFINYHHSVPYGYGVNEAKERMDFFNSNLEIVIPNFEYKKYQLSLSMGGFDYFIINNYISIVKHFTDGYGRSQYRTVIQKSNGEVILDSIEHRCFALGNYMQIFSKGQSQFLNTLTGEIGILELTTPTTKDGKIDVTKLSSINDILSIGINKTLLLQANDESKGNVKSLKLNDNKKE